MRQAFATLGLTRSNDDGNVLLWISLNGKRIAYVLKADGSVAKITYAEEDAPQPETVELEIDLVADLREVVKK